MVLSLPELYGKRVYCSYFEIEALVDINGKIISEKMLTTKSWVKDIKKKPKPQREKFEIEEIEAGEI